MTAGIVSALGDRRQPGRAGSSTRWIRPTLHSTQGTAGACSPTAAVGWSAVTTAVAGIGVGLAVPINNTTQRIISALMTAGRVRRAWLGIAGSQAHPCPPLAAKLGQA